MKIHQHTPTHLDSRFINIEVKNDTAEVKSPAEAKPEPISLFVYKGERVYTQTQDGDTLLTALQRTPPAEATGKVTIPKLEVNADNFHLYYAYISSVAQHGGLAGLPAGNQSPDTPIEAGIKIPVFGSTSVREINRQIASHMEKQATKKETSSLSTNITSEPAVSETNQETHDGSIQLSPLPDFEAIWKKETVVQEFQEEAPKGAIKFADNVSIQWDRTNYADTKELVINGENIQIEFMGKSDDGSVYFILREHPYETEGIFGIKKDGIHTPWDTVEPFNTVQSSDIINNEKIEKEVTNPIDIKFHKREGNNRYVTLEWGGRNIWIINEGGEFMVLYGFMGQANYLSRDNGESMQEFASNKDDFYSRKLANILNRGFGTGRKAQGANGGFSKEDRETTADVIYDFLTSEPAEEISTPTSDETKLPPYNETATSNPVTDDSANPIFNRNGFAPNFRR